MNKEAIVLIISLATSLILIFTGLFLSAGLGTALAATGFGIFLATSIVMNNL